MKIGFITLGCKVNIYESNALMNKFKDAGYECVIGDEVADAYIINTCSVTNMADAKSRKMIRQAKKRNPNAIICVMGCFAQTNSQARQMPEIDILLGNGNKARAFDLICEALKTHTKRHIEELLDIMNIDYYEPLEVTTFDHTRAFVKIEDGCQNFCTYCIIPYARGPIRCKDAKEAICEVRRITNMGYSEVVLAGIHTGHYFNSGYRLSDLMKEMIETCPNLKRLRLSSIEIIEIDDKLLELMKNSNVVANHLHLPLQSGAASTLVKMNRHYDKAYFKKKVEAIRAIRPDISITTDVIVGFPEETDEDFKESCEFIKELKLAKVHVFPYSRRSGTKAYDMKQVNDQVKKNRVLELIKISDELERNYATKFIGKTLEVIVEQKDSDTTMSGHTSNYLKVELPYDEKFIKQSCNVEILEVKDGFVVGKIVEN